LTQTAAGRDNPLVHPHIKQLLPADLSSTVLVLDAVRESMNEQTEVQGLSEPRTPLEDGVDHFETLLRSQSAGPLDLSVASQLAHEGAELLVCWLVVEAGEPSFQGQELRKLVEVAV